MKFRVVYLVAAFLTIFVLHVAKAGGPLLVADGKPVAWSIGDGQDPVTYRIDRGPLGPVAEKTAQQYVQEAFNVWSRVKTASIPKFQAKPLEKDIQSAEEYLGLQQDATTGNLVLFDSTGSIIDALTGVDNSEYILGWATPIAVGQRIVRFVSLFNGLLVDRNDTKELRLTLIHEFGHALGLDHAQIQWEFAHDGDAPNDVFVPTMYPTSTDSSQFRGPLHADDIAWISWLYPKADAFAMNYGSLCGKLHHIGGDPVLGSNVVAIRSNNPNVRFSATSDWLMVGDGKLRTPPPTR